MTESSLIQRHDNVKKTTSSAKSTQGICLALDDFGTGYASLSYLQEYPFDFIKIDKSFVSELDSDRTQYAIVKAILDLAACVRYASVAEGIETAQRDEQLRKMGYMVKAIGSAVRLMHRHAHQTVNHQII